ncbi:SDR family oxidoreductase [Falsiroseomonas selenitidurans]|uniref:SDR family oxidoreductase n=1 Tax=Falsiroseomonas selenitidurans TaxID=2716335 RepID=A0ABX1EFV1_9PROT|nr:SDR family oxidoreductase [Falsiroseomonas selenitidurans]NKC33775.1 SDR family oxidoreductase [Falsiroseomonas selenitidurans]
MKTILVTGCSSGFGREIARTFLERNWRVVAGMRDPRADVLPRSDHLRIVPLDVTVAESIARAVAVAGPVDVLVNNAGIGLLGALEAVPMASVRSLFETNSFGSMAMTQALLPHFRQRRGGVIVNVSSSVTLVPLPLLSAYTASKAAMNAFSDCLAEELAPFDVRVRLVLPGRAPETGFGAAARARSEGGIPESYAALAQAVFAGWQRGTLVTRAAAVAEAVWRAATDPACPIRLPAGADAEALAAGAVLQ